MEKIWEFFENMNELVYVSDIDTFELVYMNKMSRELYGISSVEELAGKKCYELLQKNNVPCKICNNANLKPGFFKEWCYFNPILNKYVSLKDTMIEKDGRRYRIEIAVDVSAQEQQVKELREYRNLEKLANDGLRIALEEPTPDKSIDAILEYLGKALHGERTYIFEKNETGGDDNTYEWIADGVHPEIHNLQNLPPEVCANWYQIFQNNKNIIIEDIEDIKEEDPLQYDNLKKQNIHSVAVVSLFNKGEIVGFYGIDNPPKEILGYAQNILEIVGSFIVSCIRRRNLLRELRNMSYCDQLTGIGNRHALYEFMENMEEAESMGVVYCDITGLKHVNDTQGHESGDKLIIRACECLRRTFGSYGIFRIGGDELLALCPKTEEKALKEKVKSLKKDMAENDVVMAIGFAWKKACSKDIEKILAKAEKLMYEDKETYYRTMGIDRRR